MVSIDEIDQLAHEISSLSHFPDSAVRVAKKFKRFCFIINDEGIEDVEITEINGK